MCAGDMVNHRFAKDSTTEGLTHPVLINDFYILDKKDAFVVRATSAKLHTAVPIVGTANFIQA